MIFTTLLVMVIGVWLPYSPLAPLLGFVPLPATYFIWIAGYLVTYSVITHKVKTWFIRRFEGV